MEPNVHTLANGATLIFTSPGHGARFSDGTSCPPQHKEVCDRLNCKRVFSDKGKVKGMALVGMQMILDDDQLKYLADLAGKADLVVVPFPVLAALREQGVRQRFPNVVSTIATKETERVPPDQKVWDVEKWSY